MSFSENKLAGLFTRCHFDSSIILVCVRWDISYKLSYRDLVAIMAEAGLSRGENGLEVYVMCELSANVILTEEFAEIFDGCSIGSNDLTQLTLDLDRDSAIVAHLFDERNAAVMRLVREVIQRAQACGRKVGICGQAPSDYPEFARFLATCGIDSMSLNPDTVIKITQDIVALERQRAEQREAVA